jgi:O-antigen/teichoic acid export membrane protein
MSKSKLADQAIFVIISKFLEPISILALAMILTRKMSLSDYGTYQQVMLICITVSIFIAFGLPDSVYYFLPRTQNKKRFLLRTLLLLNLLGIVATIVIVAVRNPLGEWMNNPRLPELALIFGFYLIGLASYQMLDSTFLSLGRGRSLALVNVVFSLLFFLFVSVPVLLGMPLKAILTSILIYYLAQAVFLLVFILRLSGELGDFRKGDNLGEQLRYSAPIGGSRLSGTLAKAVDRFVISFFYTPKDYAIYDRGAMQLPFVNIFAYTIGAVLLPRYVEFHREGKSEEVLKLWHESVRQVALIMFAIFALCLFFARDVITVLFTDTYLGSVSIFKIYLLLLPFQVTAYGSILRATKNTKHILYVTLMELTVNIILSLTLVRLLGPKGPAVATIITRTCGVSYYLLVIKNILRVDIKRVFPWKVLSKQFLLALACAWLIHFLMGQETSSLDRLLVAGSAYGAVYLGSLKLLKMLTPKDEEIIKRWVTLKAILGRA